MFLSLIALLIASILSSTYASPHPQIPPEISAPLQHWPRIPFSYAFRYQEQYSIIFTHALRIGSQRDVSRAQANIRSEIDYTRTQRDWSSGPNILNVTDKAGKGPWLGCKKADPQWLGIPWTMQTTRNFLITLQSLLGQNGFQEFWFSVGENEERIIASCRLEFDVDGAFFGDAAVTIGEAWKGLEVLDPGVFDGLEVTIL